MARIVDVDVILVYNNVRSVKVKADEDAIPVWLPMSLIEVDPHSKNGVTTISLPDWLAEREGLI